MTGVEKLLKKGGTPREIAESLTDEERECTRQLVQYWVKEGRVTPKWAQRVNRVYGIPLHELNPSIYPKTNA